MGQEVRLSWNYTALCGNWLCPLCDSSLLPLPRHALKGCGGLSHVGAGWGVRTPTVSGRYVPKTCRLFVLWSGGGSGVRVLCTWALDVQASRLKTAAPFPYSTVLNSRAARGTKPPLAASWHLGRRKRNGKKPFGKIARDCDRQAAGGCGYTL